MPNSKTSAKKIDNKYAVIQLAGKQYLVHEGEQITVDKIAAEPDAKIKINDVLLAVDGKERRIGTPLVDKAEVVLQVISQQKEKKIRVATYKAKSRYRRVKGHRSHTTTLQVVKIGV